MGLKNLPAKYSRVINDVIGRFRWDYCLIYIDDLIIMANEMRELSARMRVIFARLREAKIQLQPKKCHFGITRMSYLGHVIENGECQPDPKSVAAVVAMASPKDVTEVQS